MKNLTYTSELYIYKSAMKIPNVFILFCFYVVLASCLDARNEYSSECIYFEYPEYIESVEMKVRSDHSACNNVAIGLAMHFDELFKIAMRVSKIPDPTTDFDVYAFTEAQRQQAVEAIGQEYPISIVYQSAPSEVELTSVGEIIARSANYQYFSQVQKITTPVKLDDGSVTLKDFSHSSFLAYSRNGDYLVELFGLPHADFTKSEFESIADIILGSLQIDN